jgi:transcriptional regulator with XRE-family HTH domain
MADAARAKTYEAFGAYVRSQRELAQLSLRQAAELARISNPYLSQIEHGLTLPSVAVLSALAEALQVSADHLLVRAAGAASGNPDRATDATEDAIRHDPRLDVAQKRALLGVLATYVATPPAPSPTSTTTTRRRRTATSAPPDAPRKGNP